MLATVLENKGRLALSDDLGKARRLHGLTIVCRAIHAELKSIAAALPSFSADPAGHPLSPAMRKLQNAARFCGQWGMANMIGAMVELSSIIEQTARSPGKERGEQEERIKTLAQGVNALGVHARETAQGHTVSYIALNDVFAKVVKKARPNLLDLSPAQSARLMFMPVPPSIEVEAEWAPAAAASRTSFVESLMELERALGDDGGVSVAQAAAAACASNPYRSLAGLLEVIHAVASACPLEDPQDIERVRQEISRIRFEVNKGEAITPVTPDAFLFSELMHRAASFEGRCEWVDRIRAKYSLSQPRSGSGSVSMHDIAKRFVEATEKLKEAYQQAMLSNTPKSLQKVGDSLLRESSKLESAAFTTHASNFAWKANELTQGRDSFEDWVFGAATVLLMQEAASSWGNDRAQTELDGLGAIMRGAGNVCASSTLQSSMRTLAIQKACSSIVADAARAKISVESAVRAIGLGAPSPAEVQKMAAGIGAEVARLMEVAKGVLDCVGLHAGARVADAVRIKASQPETWATPEGQHAIFDGLSRVTELFSRIRPSSLIDMQPEEAGDWEPHLRAGTDATQGSLASPSEGQVDLAGAELDGGQGQTPLHEATAAGDHQEVGAESAPKEGAANARTEVEKVQEQHEDMPGVHEFSAPGHEATQEDHGVAPDGQPVSMESRVSDCDEPATGMDKPSAMGAIAQSSSEEPTEQESAGDDLLTQMAALDAPQNGGAGAGAATENAQGCAFGIDFDDADLDDPFGPARAEGLAINFQPQEPSELLRDFLAAAEGRENQLDTGDQELLKIMFEESAQCLEDIQSLVGRWAQEPAGEGLVGTVAEIRRHVHTLKGVLRTCGLMGAGAILHAMEDRLEITPDDGAALSQEVEAYDQAMRGVAEVVEAARSDYELALSGQDPQQSGAPADASYSFGAEHDGNAGETLQQAADSSAQTAPAATAGGEDPQPAQASHAHPASSADPAATTASTPAPTSQTENDSQAGAAGETEPGLGATVGSAPPAKPAQQLHSTTQRAPTGTAQTVRVPLSSAVSLGESSGRVMMDSQRTADEIERAARSLVEFESGLNRMGPLLRSLDILASASIASSAAHSSKGTHGFDALELDRYTELQEVVRSLKEAYEDTLSASSALSENIRSLQASSQVSTELAGELQMQSSELIMVSLATQKQRLEKSVATACKDTGKSATVEVAASCRVPASSVDRIMPAIEHLVRNAVAHGIESPEKRIEAGKSASGSIVIAMSEGGSDAGSVSICVRDDGAGIDIAKVLQVAIKKGLASKERNYDESAILEFMFMPGFSTASSVSELAGRGVGLDAVRSIISSLGGMVSVKTRAGVGTEFTLSMPSDASTMAVIPVSAEGFNCMVPLSLVARIVPAVDGLALHDGGRVEIDGVEHDLIMLPGRAPVEYHRRTSARRQGHLLVMRSPGLKKAVFVDAIGPQRKVAVRPLGPYVRSVPGLLATAQAATGELRLVVNPMMLQPSSQGAGQSETASRAKAPLRRVLVVDDSSTVRLATARFLSKNGYQTSTAKDGLDALEQISQGLRPDAIVLDLEMPGMDGFSLMAELRRREATKTIPMVVISSRTAEKHRARAQDLGASHYLAKPFEDSLLLKALKTL